MTPNTVIRTMRQLGYTKVWRTPHEVGLLTRWPSDLFLLVRCRLGVVRWVLIPELWHSDGRHLTLTDKHLTARDVWELEQVVAQLGPKSWEHRATELLAVT